MTAPAEFSDSVADLTCDAAFLQQEEFAMTTLTRADWEQRAQQLKIEGRAFILSLIHI